MRSLSLVICACLALGLVSCKTDTTAPPPVSPPAADVWAGTEAESARVRLVHLHPDAGPADLFVTSLETAEVSHVRFEELLDGALLPPGTWDLVVFDAAGELARADSVKLQAGHRIDAVLWQSATGAAVLDITAPIDETDASVASVRYVNLAGGLGDIAVFGPNGDVLADVAVGEVGPFMALGPGQHTLALDTRGDAVADTTHSLPELPVGGRMTAFVVSTAAGPTLHIETSDGVLGRFEPNPVEGPQLRVVHLSPSAGPAPVVIGAFGTDEPLTFGSATDWIPLDAGVHALSFDAAELEPWPLQLAARYTAVVYDGPDGMTSTLLTEDAPDPAATDTGFRLLHTAHNTGDIGLRSIVDNVPGASLVQGLQYGIEHTTLQPTALFQTVELSVDTAADPAWWYPLESPAGERVGLFVTQPSADGPMVLFMLRGGSSLTRIDRESAPQATLRVAHVGPTLDPWDFLLADEPVAGGVSFLSPHAPVQRAPGNYELSAKPQVAQGNTDTLSIAAPLTRPAGHYLAVLYEGASAPELTLFEEHSPGLRVMNAGGWDALDVSWGADNAVLSAGQAAAPMEPPAGPFQVVIQTTGFSLMATLDGSALADERATLFVVDQPPGAAALLLLGDGSFSQLTLEASSR